MQQRSSLQTGFFYGLLAYLLWGAFPFYFGLIENVNPFEVIPWRVLTAFVFCVIAVTLAREWQPVLSVLRTPKLLGMFALSGVLLYINWQVFIYGVATDRVLETSLGYFLNPLITIFLGVVFWKEKLRVTQWLAVAAAAIGVLVAAIAYGQFPFIALGVGFSFGLYGAVRKAAGVNVSALSGLTIETVMVLPIAVTQLLLFSAAAGGSAVFTIAPFELTILLLSGAVTAIPLLLFGASTKRLPLSYMGFLQFLTPILSFLYGWQVLHEPMPAARWVGFIAVWIAVALLLFDMTRTLIRARTERRRLRQVDFPVTGEIGVITQPDPHPKQPPKS